MNLQEPCCHKSKKVREPRDDIRRGFGFSATAEFGDGSESDSSSSSASSAGSSATSLEPFGSEASKRSSSSQDASKGSSASKQSRASKGSSDSFPGFFEKDGGRNSLSSKASSSRARISQSSDWSRSRTSQSSDLRTSQSSDRTQKSTPRGGEEHRSAGKWTKNKKRRTIFGGGRNSGEKLRPEKSRWTSLYDTDLQEAQFLKILDLLEEQEEFESTSDAGETDSSSALNLDEDEAELDMLDDDVSEESDTDWNLLCSESRPLEDWELVGAAFDLQQRRLPQQDVAARIIRDVSNLYANSDTVVRLERPGPSEKFIIVGDLHGHFGDLMHIIDEYGEPEPGRVSYLFNGDFVDRGSWGPEVLLLVYCLKLQFPAAVHLNRGNHEDEQQNRKPENGFCHQHCLRAWATQGEPMYQLCRRSFKQLPLVHILGTEIAVMHGGLPLDRGVTLQEIDEIDRKHRVPVFSCNLLGYTKNQKVKAKRKLTGLHGEVIDKGATGRLVWRVGKTSQARVRFETPAVYQVDAEVTIAGAPELEQDVMPIFDSQEQSKKKRIQRIFVSLLWSDPCPLGYNGPSRRGVGCFFDEKVTQEFLDTNGLSCILRSHQKKPQGFCEEHRHSKRGLILSTVFSASNYPSGAGEPAGNKAAVLIIHGVAASGKLMPPDASSAPSWREPYALGSQSFAKPGRGSVHKQLKAVEICHTTSEGPVKVESARVRVLQKLRCMIYSARPALLNYWNRVDEDTSGYVNLREWASAMRACVVPDQTFPWEWLAQHLTFVDTLGRCQYATFLGRYENTLVRRLALRWHGGALVQLAPGVTTKEAAIQKWAEIDRNGDGKLSYTELRPLLKTSHPIRRSRRRNTAIFDATLDDDRVYSILASLDSDRSGFVERDEFVRAVMRANQQEQSLIERAEGFEGDTDQRVRVSSQPVHRSSQCSRRYSLQSNGGRGTSIFGATTEMVITQCWAALQGALRMLSSARASAETVFTVLDQDGDGEIDRAEFRDGLTRLLRDSALLKSIDDWEPLLWKLVDEDGSGSVSPKELAQLLRVRDIVSL